jgi:hypothetical protein
MRNPSSARGGRKEERKEKRKEGGAKGCRRIPIIDHNPLHPVLGFPLHSRKRREIPFFNVVCCCGGPDAHLPLA